VCEDDVVRVACRPCDIRRTPVVYCGEFAAEFHLLHVSFVNSAKWVQRMSSFVIRFAQSPHFE
jgi:hypothetical protein